MFVCGTKNKNKNKPTNQPIKPEDLTTCKLHNNKYEQICIAKDCEEHSNSTLDTQRSQVRLCKSCLASHQHCEIITIKELEKLLQSQKSADLLEQIIKKLKKPDSNLWRDSLHDYIARLKDMIQSFQELLMSSYFLVEKLPQAFTATDVSLILNQQVLQSFEDVSNQVKQIKNIDDETIYILGKVLKYEKETNELLACVEPDMNEVKKKVSIVQKEIDSTLKYFEKSVNSISINTKQHQPKVEEPDQSILGFIQEAQAMTQLKFDEYVGQIQKVSLINEKHFSFSRQG